MMSDGRDGQRPCPHVCTESSSSGPLAPRIRMWRERECVWVEGRGRKRGARREVSERATWTERRPCRRSARHGLGRRERVASVAKQELAASCPKYRRLDVLAATRGGPGRVGWTGRSTDGYRVLARSREQRTRRTSRRVVVIVRGASLGRAQGRAGQAKASVAVPVFVPEPGGRGWLAGWVAGLEAGLVVLRCDAMRCDAMRLEVRRCDQDPSNPVDSECRGCVQ
ncbi:uncharacterized protein J3D65DRAFT_264004 [Phyllosticta citribraziliensis]|uniref:Uncharacterized protein n=1 Tax=Phyllosticta citribraziliensis TaxID=989973 RepID=A0ABR1M0R0_9PEZI